MKKIKQFFTEHALVFVIAAIALISLILIIIVFTLVSSGSSERTIKIDSISGNAFILKTDGQIPATPNTKLSNGDVIITSADGEVRLCTDNDTYIYIEPDTTLYVNYTELSNQGSIIVNISQGAAICRLDSKLSRNEAFEVRTPNAVISAAGTVFRTQFDFFEEYRGNKEAKVTEVQCSQGEVHIQLYDNDSAPMDQLMALAAGKSAKLMTCAEKSMYEYLNSPTELNRLTETTIKTFIRIAAERDSGYSLSELNIAYQNILNSAPRPETTISTMYPPAEQETPAATTQTVTETTPPEIVTEGTSAPETSEQETTTTEPTAADTAVTSPTTSVAMVTTTTETVPSITTTIPPIRQEEPVTTSPTTARQPEPVQTTAPHTSIIPPKSTIPWWEIINSNTTTQSTTTQSTTTETEN